MSDVRDNRTFVIGGELTVHRMGFGAMRLLGEHGYGPPADRAEADRVLHRAMELGVDFIDTADAYGPYINEAHLAATLRPYPKRLVIATKGGNIRFRDRYKIVRNSTPAYIREAFEGSLRRLKLDCIDLYQLHRLDGETPIEDTVGVLADLRREGKLRHIGLCNVNLEELQRARTVSPIATVQNKYNLIDREHDDVLRFCEANAIGFIPWYPLAAGALAQPGSPLAAIAERLGVSTSQVSLAWLLAKSPVILLIPGTSSVEHLQQNVAARDVVLAQADILALDHFSSTEGTH